MFRLVSYLTLGAQAALLKKTEALVEKAEKDARAGQTSLLSMGTNTNQVLIFRVKNCRLHILMATAVVHAESAAERVEPDTAATTAAVELDTTAA